jgi:hypothetical protein
MLLSMTFHRISIGSGDASYCHLFDLLTILQKGMNIKKKLAILKIHMVKIGYKSMFT